MTCQSTLCTCQALDSLGSISSHKRPSFLGGKRGARKWGLSKCPALARSATTSPLGACALLTTPILTSTCQIATLEQRAPRQTQPGLAKCLLGFHTPLPAAKLLNIQTHTHAYLNSSRSSSIDHSGSSHQTGHTPLCHIGTNVLQIVDNIYHQGNNVSRSTCNLCENNTTFGTTCMPSDLWN